MVRQVNARWSQLRKNNTQYELLNKSDLPSSTLVKDVGKESGFLLYGIDRSLPLSIHPEKHYSVKFYWCDGSNAERRVRHTLSLHITLGFGKNRFETDTWATLLKICTKRKHNCQCSRSDRQLRKSFSLRFDERRIDVVRVETVS